MSKTLVAYYSGTGNTKKIAEAIYNAVEGDKIIKSLKDVGEGEVGQYDMVFVGFPVHSHSVPYPVEVFLKALPPGKKTAFFSTHGSLSGSRLSREALEYATVLASKAKVLGTFACRGKVSPRAHEFLKKSPEHQAWSEMAASAASHPNETDLEEARSFAKWVALLAAQN